MDDITRAFILQLANRIYLCFEILARNAERRRKPKGPPPMTTDYTDLAARLERKASTGSGVCCDDLMREAAAAIRAQATRIAELERQVDPEPERCRTMIDGERCIYLKGHSGVKCAPI